MLSRVLAPVVIFCAGVATGSVVAINLPIITWVFLISLVFILVGTRRQLSTTTQIRVYLWFGLGALFFGLGLLRMEIASWQFGQSALVHSLNQEVTLDGIVIQEPDYRERNVQLYIESGEDILLVSTDRHTAIRYGDKVQVKGNLEQPETFTTDLGRTFDYPKYLQVRGVEYVMSFAEVEVRGHGYGNPIISLLLTTKEKFIDSLKQVINEPEVGLGQGLLLGVKSSLGDEIEEDFRRTGIIHIVVLSGYNVMLVVAFILFCFSFFLSLRWRAVAGIVAIISFALIVGLSATVVRASIMASLVLYAQAFGRQYDVLRALFFAGFIMIVINPYLLLYDIGFQLSFMATLGLILIVPRFETQVIETKQIFTIREFVLATVATQIAVLPLLLYNIGEISLLAVVVNVLVLPIVPLAMLLTFITGLLGFFSLSLASLVGYVASLSLTYILKVAEYFGGLPFATIAVPEFPAWMIPVMYSILGGLLYYTYNRPTRKPDELSGWNIVEEETKTADSSTSPNTTDKSTDDVPVFFR